MAFSRLFYSPFTSNDFYSPFYENSSSLALLDALMNDSLPRAHLLVKPKRQTSVATGCGDFSDPNKFQVMLNVKHFKPEELSVKTMDNHIVIHGKHEESADEHGFISREFTRRYAIPEGVEAEKVQSSLSQDGVLTVSAPRKCLEAPPKNERVVPITIQQTAAIEQQQKLQEQAQAAQTEAKEDLK